MEQRRRHPLDKPFELFLLALCLLQGVGILLTGPPPESISAILDQRLILLWGGLLAIGSFAALLGIFWRGRIISSYIIEQVGLILCGGGTLVYGLAVFNLASWRGSFAGGISLAFSLACVVRTRTLQRLIREMVSLAKDAG